MTAALFYLSVFVVMTITDFVWGQYTAQVAGENALKSGLWSVGIIILGSYVTTAYVHDPWAIIPAGFGAFCGTYISVKWSKR